LAATGRLDVPTVDAPLVLSFTRGAVCWARGTRRSRSWRDRVFWRLAGNEPVVFGSPEEFLTFTEPAFAKEFGGFRLDPGGAEILLTTETRFVATDEVTHRLMSRYRRIIRAGSKPRWDGLDASDPKARASPPERDPGVLRTPLGSRERLPRARADATCSPH
jgi:hypothetical protein